MNNTSLQLFNIHILTYVHQQNKIAKNDFGKQGGKKEETRGEEE